MRFKTELQKTQYYSGNLDSRVIIIAEWLDNYCINRFNLDIMITSVWRDWGSGVHQDWRAVDVGNNAWNTKENESIRDAVNDKFPRKGIYKTCVLHNVGLGNHFHLQVGWGGTLEISKSIPIVVIGILIFILWKVKGG